MSATNRRRNGFSPTTVILVLLLLGAVAGASRLVSPPPKDPPPPVKATEADPATKAQQQAMMQQHMGDQNKKMHDYMDSPVGKLKKVEDPGHVIITNDYFLSHKPGAAGLHQVDAELADQTVKYKEYLQKRAAVEAAYRKEHNLPGDAPVKPTPVPHGPVSVPAPK